jgi:ubiquinol-cytochrome c reductase cytochrome c subunit
MPLPSPEAASRRRKPAYDAATTRAIVDYVAQLAPDGPPIPSIDLAGADIADGGSVYRAQCAACHQWGGQGGALQTGNAPQLHSATPVQIAEAIRTGPTSMPVFDEQAVNAQQLTDLVGYVRTLNDPQDSGGAALWHLGPLPEGALALVALGLLVVVLVRLGTRT